MTEPVITLTHKVDFAVIFTVHGANPNGDPLNGNRPRIDYDGMGEVSDVCLKRKIRDRLMESGAQIFVQSDDRKIDDCASLKDRAESEKHGLGKAAFIFAAAKRSKNAEGTSARDTQEFAKKKETALLACRKWFDVRAFGQLFAFKTKSNNKGEESATEEGAAKNKGENSVSIPIRGPVTVRSAFSVERVDISSLQIVKSAPGQNDGTERGRDSMGMKHRVDKAVYVFFGSMNPQLAVATEFTDADAEAIKAVLRKLFENDVSSARPDGSMRVLKVLWWKHNSKAGQYSSAKVHGTLKVHADGSYTLSNLEGLSPEESDGF